MITFVICSGTLGKEFVPQIHQKKNIWAIYIYCRDVDAHQSWSSSYPKVKTIRSSLKHLLKDLIYNVQEYKEYEKDGSFNNRIFNTIGRHQKTTDRVDLSLVRFTTMLYHLPYPVHAHNQLVYRLKDYYQNDTAKLREINDFEENYKSDNAILWYTRPIFLYKLLNKALLVHDFQIAVLFGFVIRDLYRQLGHEKEKYKLKHLNDHPIYKVYRGQMMTRSEIQELLGLLEDYNREVVSDSYITNTSFFSTTQDRNVAMAFLPKSSTPDDQIQGILFEIELDVRLKSCPYADITHLSYLRDESETLIAMGCIFDLFCPVYNETERCWICKLKLVNSSDEFNVRQYESTSERRTLKTCVNKLLHDYMPPNVEQGTQIFDSLIDLFPREKWITAAKCQFLLSKPNLRDNPEYLQRCNELIYMWSDYVDDSEINCFAEIAYIHQEYLAKYHRKNLSKEHYELAIICYQLAIENASTNYERMNIYEQLAAIHHFEIIDYIKNEDEKIESIRMGIKYRKLHVECMLSCNLTDARRIPELMQWVSRLHESIFEYDDALIYYDKTLKLLQEQSKPDFSAIHDVLTSILKIYQEQKYDLDAVLKYKLIQHEYINRDANETPFEEYNIYYEVDQEFELRMRKQKICESHIEVAQCALDVNNYHLANEHLSEALEMVNNPKNRMKDFASKIETLKERLNEQKH